MRAASKPAPKPVLKRASVKPVTKGRTKPVPYKRPKPNEVFRRSMVVHHQVPGEGGKAQEHGNVKFMSHHNIDSKGTHNIISFQGGH